MSVEHPASEPASLALRLLPLAFFTALFGCLAYYVAFSWHWPILRDTSVMHYVIFLTRHGFTPYRQITDNNLPGAYLAERLGMTVFGGSDLGWRFADWTLLVLITIGMIVIARPYDWRAGLFGGGMFALLHGSEGPDFPMEREQMVATLLILGFALLFLAIRRRQPVLTLFFGLVTGAAATIKPTTAPFSVVLLLLAALAFRRQLPGLWRYVVYGLVGVTLSGLVAVGFLLWYHAVPGFLFIMRDVLPSYIGLATRRMPELIFTLFPRNLMPVMLVAALIAVVARGWNAERWLLFLGMLFGAASYIAQRKGSIYHRYPFLVFVLLLIGLELFTALRRRGLVLALGILGFLLTAGVSLPHYISQLRRAPVLSTMPFAVSLHNDLATMEQEGDLQHNIECLDLTYGCFSALYRLRIVQYNGFTGDLLLLFDRPSKARDFYRNWFWTSLEKRPPTVFVLSNEWFAHNFSFRKLDTWPAFADYLRQNYVVVVARRFSPETGAPEPASPDPDYPEDGYRIYVRRDSPLLAKTEHLFASSAAPLPPR